VSGILYGFRETPHGRELKKQVLETEPESRLKRPRWSAAGNKTNLFGLRTVHHYRGAKP